MTKPRRRFSRGRAALLIGLVVVLIGAGSLGIFYLARNALSPNPYPPYTGTLALDDSLSGNAFTWPFGNSLTWPQYVHNSKGSCQFTGGSYHVDALAQASYGCFNGTTNLSNFAYQVQMTIIKGDFGGIIFRANDTTFTLYEFRIGQDGSYELDRYIDNQPSHLQLLKHKTSSVIHTGLNQSNIIAVVANDSTLDLYVNSQKIDSVTDTTYTSGLIGVVAYSTSNPTEVAFTNAKAWGL